MHDRNAALNIATVAARTGPRFAEPKHAWAEVNGVPAAEIMAELARINSSADFAGSPRNRRVLEYLVLGRLEGRDDELKAYHIATRVYGRPESFDPLRDPIVRIEISRLRRDLEMYYLKSGARNPLRISIPLGAYVPWVSRPLRDEKVTSTADQLLVSVLRASLCAWSGDGKGAAAAWQDLKLADPTWPANLQTCVSRALGDEKVARLVVEGVLRAGRWADSPQSDPGTDELL